MRRSESKGPLRATAKRQARRDSRKKNYILPTTREGSMKDWK